MTPSAGKHNGCGPANRDGLLDPASRSISESIPETILITEQQPHYLTRGNRLMRIVRFTVQNDLETQAYALASEADLIECGALAPEPSAMTEEELGAELDKMRHICETQRVTITDLRRRLELKERGSEGFGSTGIRERQNSPSVGSGSGAESPCDNNLGSGSNYAAPETPLAAIEVLSR
jgi:hypothetical protein